jgi:hypothetical protein
MTEQPTAKKPRKEKVFPCDIKNFDLFGAAFPNVTIPDIDCEHVELPPPANWTSPEAKIKIANFLERFASRSYELLNDCRRISNESDLYPLFFGMLSQLKATTNDFFIVETRFETHKSDDDVAQAAHTLSSAVLSRRSSLSSGAPAGQEQPVEPEDEGGLPDAADMSCAEDVMKVYLAMEKWFKSHPSEIQGRAELVLTDVKTMLTRAIFEVKCKAMYEGLYQCAACMVLASAEKLEPIGSSGTSATSPQPSSRVVWGVVSNFGEWRFLRLEGNTIQISNSFTFYSGDRYNIEFMPTALSIVAFLFHIFSIQPSIDTSAVFHTVDVANYTKAAIKWLK